MPLIPSRNGVPSKHRISHPLHGPTETGKRRSGSGGGGPPKPTRGQAPRPSPSPGGPAHGTQGPNCLELSTCSSPSSPRAETCPKTEASGRQGKHSRAKLRVEAAGGRPGILEQGGGGEGGRLTPAPPDPRQPGRASIRPCMRRGAPLTLLPHLGRGLPEKRSVIQAAGAVSAGREVLHFGAP